MQKSLIDSGPLIALFDRDDRYHVPVMSFLKEYHGHLLTSWPVITEVSHLLDFHARAQIDFLKWVSLGGLHMIQLDHRDLDRLIVLMEKYSDIPMDLADGSLIVISESLNIRNIITIDSDYYIYRTNRKRALKNLLQGYL